MACKVVSIEDEPEISELLRIVLSSPHIDVYCCDNGPDGIELIRSVKPDLVVLDIMLPGMNGWAIYDVIRADENLKTTPVVMLSVLREEPGRRQASVGSPIDLYITKPFDTARLRSDIERMLGRKGLWPATKPLIRTITAEESPLKEPVLADNGLHEIKPAPEPAEPTVSAQKEPEVQAISVPEKPAEQTVSAPNEPVAAQAVAPTGPPPQVIVGESGDKQDQPDPQPVSETPPVTTNESVTVVEKSAASSESNPMPDSSATSS